MDGLGFKENFRCGATGSRRILIMVPLGIVQVRASLRLRLSDEDNRG